MIQITHGDLLSAEVDAIVNTVNTVGVMGKGIALQFKQRFPGNFKAYAAACKQGEVQLGRMFVYDLGALVSPRWIINFPTKGHWRSSSRIADIETGLDDLVRAISEQGIRSIALPPLGCGNGGLVWVDVKPLIESKLAGIDAHVFLYEPAGSPAASSIGTDRPRMSLGKAALVSVVDGYARSTLDGAGLIEIQKLMYFLQVAGQDLRLNFAKALYGPYADNLRQVLIRVDRHFLTGFGDGTGPVRNGEPIRVVDSAAREAADVVASDAELGRRIERVLELAEGFESPYGMELLATVHWAATAEGCHDRPCVVEVVHGWNKRKERMFTPPHIGTALDRLIEHGWLDRESFAA